MERLPRAVVCPATDMILHWPKVTPATQNAKRWGIGLAFTQGAFAVCYSHRKPGRPLPTDPSAPLVPSDAPASPASPLPAQAGRARPCHCLAHFLPPPPAAHPRQLVRARVHTATPPGAKRVCSEAVVQGATVTQAPETHDPRPALDTGVREGLCRRSPSRATVTPSRARMSVEHLVGGCAPGMANPHRLTLPPGAQQLSKKVRR